ncbi:MAG: hypothetical protein ABR915_02105 [Thermoguttaceae bacterium]|jgi:Na+/proline symporter
MGFMDWTIVAVYLAGMLAIGIWAMRRIHDPGGFLLGKRKMGKLMMIASTFSSGTSANDPVTVASQCYTSGVSGVWFSLYNLFLTPIFWMMPPAYRRLRMVTMVDFIRMRYGRELEVFYNVVQTIVSTLAIGGGIKAASLVVAAVSRGALHEFWWQVIIAALILGYGLPGGIIAVFATDIVQSLLIVVLSFILLPFAAAKVGGMGGLADKVAPAMFRLFSEEMSPQWVFWAALGGIFSIMAESRQAAHGGARNEISARCSVFGMFVKRVCTVGWMMAGVFAIGLYGTGLAEPNKVFAMMSQDVLPAGLLGILVASILAAAMALGSGGMVFGTSILLNNIYRRFLVPSASPKHYLLVARIGGAVMVLLGLLMATMVQDLVQYVLKVAQVATVVGLPVACAIFWRRGTRAGAIAAALVMGPLFYYGTQYASLPEAWRFWLLDRYAGPGGGLPLTVWTPLYLVPGIVTFVLVSLLTRQHDERSVREFYARLDTPVGEEARLREQGIEVDLLERLDGTAIAVSDKDHDLSRRLLLVDLLVFPHRVLTGKGGLSDYKWDFVGIVIVGLFAVALIGVVAWFGAAATAHP